MADYEWEPLTPAEAHDLFATFVRPWWVAGGWALDLHLRRETRPHADIDLAILRGDEVALPGLLPGWEIHIAHDSKLTPWNGDGPLAMPYHQFWVRREGAEAWSFEVLLEDHGGGEWLFRRDHRVRISLDRFGRVTADGMPYVPPEVALLYKAKGHEVEKNGADFDASLPSLDTGARRWLREAIEVAHPRHPWLARL